MLEYRAADVGRLLKNAVTGTLATGPGRVRPDPGVCTSAALKRLRPPSDLRPRGAGGGFIPGLPAYIIFMCVRYADRVNDDQRVTSLLNSAISSIKGVVKVTPRG